MANQHKKSLISFPLSVLLIETENEGYHKVSESNHHDFQSNFDYVHNSLQISEENAEPVTKEMIDYFSNFNPIKNMDTYNEDKILENRDNVINMNALTYIAGYVCHKLLKVHQCENCKLILIDQSDYEVKNNNIYLRNKDLKSKNFLTYPSRTIKSIIKEHESVLD